MKDITKKFVTTCEQILRSIQPANRGQLFKTSIPNCTSLLLDFSSKTLENLNLSHSFSRMYQIITSGNSLNVIEHLPRSFENPIDLKAKSISPSGKIEIRIRKPSINAKETLILEVWDDGRLIKTKDLSKAIKMIYNDEMFGSVSWSQDETLIAFVAGPCDKTYSGIWEDQEDKRMLPIL